MNCADMARRAIKVLLTHRPNRRPLTGPTKYPAGDAAADPGLVDAWNRCRT